MEQGRYSAVILYEQFVARFQRDIIEHLLSAGYGFDLHDCSPRAEVGSAESAHGALEAFQ
ncbi:hypothetical protein ACIQYM_37630 [Rhodococcus erythropolis]